MPAGSNAGRLVLFLAGCHRRFEPPQARREPTIVHRLRHLDIDEPFRSMEDGNVLALERKPKLARAEDDDPPSIADLVDDSRKIGFIDSARPTSSGDFRQGDAALAGVCRHDGVAVVDLGHGTGARRGAPHRLVGRSHLAHLLPALPAGRLSLSSARSA